MTQNLMRDKDTKSKMKKEIVYNRTKAKMKYKKLISIFDCDPIPAAGYDDLHISH